MFFKLLKDALKVKNVRNKILFTIFIIFVFRVGTHVTVLWYQCGKFETIK